MERSGIVFGWVFASHMVGAGVAAPMGGLIRTSTGDYSAAWFAAGVLRVVAAFAVLTIPKPPAAEAAEADRVDPTAPEPAQLSLS